MAEYQLIGLGTYRLQDELCTNIVKYGLELGYRQIDTAQLYHNHHEIFNGIKLSGISREDIFIISKIHNKNIKKLKISESIDLIKKELDTNYMDLILLHNPVKNYENAWEELIRVKTHMNVKHIGVSNFDIEHLEKILLKTNIKPFLNQIELNIFNQRKKLIAYNELHGIHTQSHTTLAKSNLLNNSDLISISELVGLEPPDTMFKFILDMDIGILFKTSNLSHLEHNYKLNKMKKIFDIDFYNRNKDILKKIDIGYSLYK